MNLVTKIAGIQVSNVAINFEAPCLLSGKIPILELRDNILVPSGFLKNTTLSLESTTTGKNYSFKPMRMVTFLILKFLLVDGI